jgi:hypothetical protein
MSFKIISKKKRKAALIECIDSLDVKDIKQIAKKYEIDYRTLKGDCYDIVEEIDSMLQKKNLVGRIKNYIQSISKKIIP